MQHSITATSIFPYVSLCPITKKFLLILRSIWLFLLNLNEGFLLPLAPLLFTPTFEDSSTTLITLEY